MGYIGLHRCVQCLRSSRDECLSQGGRACFTVEHRCHNLVHDMTCDSHCTDKMGNVSMLHHTAFVQRSPWQQPKRQRRPTIGRRERSTKQSCPRQCEQRVTTLYLRNLTAQDCVDGFWSVGFMSKPTACDSASREVVTRAHALGVEGETAAGAGGHMQVQTASNTPRCLGAKRDVQGKRLCKTRSNLGMHLSCPSTCCSYAVPVWQLGMPMHDMVHIFQCVNFFVCKGVNRRHCVPVLAHAKTPKLFCYRWGIWAGYQGLLLTVIRCSADRWLAPPPKFTDLWCFPRDSYSRKRERAPTIIDLDPDDTYLIIDGKHGDTIRSLQQDVGCQLMRAKFQRARRMLGGEVKWRQGRRGTGRQYLPLLEPFCNHPRSIKKHRKASPRTSAAATQVAAHLSCVEQCGSTGATPPTASTSSNTTCASFALLNRMPEATQAIDTASLPQTWEDLQRDVWEELQRMSDRDFEKLMKPAGFVSTAGNLGTGGLPHVSRAGTCGATTVGRTVQQVAMARIYFEGRVSAPLTYVSH
jgi:hypothetical protein